VSSPDRPKGVLRDTPLDSPAPRAVRPAPQAHSGTHNLKDAKDSLRSDNFFALRLQIIPFLDSLYGESPY